MNPISLSKSVYGTRSYLNLEEFPVHGEGESNSNGDNPDGDDDGSRSALGDPLHDITQQRMSFQCTSCVGS